MRSESTNSWFKSTVTIAAVITMAALGVVVHAETPMLSSAEWPMTIQDSVRDILSHMTTEEKARIRSAKERDLIQLYLDLGVGIRNRYGLWRGNDRLILSACGYPCHPDDAALKIVEALWRELRR
jgi:hypothetical protein